MLVRAVGGQGIESISYGDHARQQRYLVVLEPVGIAAAIQRFMVELDAGQHRCQLFHRAKDVRPLGGVRFHDFKFFRG